MKYSGRVLSESHYRCIRSSIFFAGSLHRSLHHLNMLVGHKGSFHSYSSNSSISYIIVVLIDSGSLAAALGAAAAAAIAGSVLASTHGHLVGVVLEGGLSLLQRLSVSGAVRYVGATAFSTYWLLGLDAVGRGNAHGLVNSGLSLHLDLLGGHIDGRWCLSGGDDGGKGSAVVCDQRLSAKQDDYCNSGEYLK
jgi:hypothetical protein